MRIFNLVKVRFDIRRADITQDWLEKRYTFFQEYTLRSLVQQTNKNWLLWINCQEGMQNKVRRLRDEILQQFSSATGIDYLFTFGDDPIPRRVLEAFGDFILSDYAYVTRIDSDDLYAPDALELIQKVKPIRAGNIEASMFKRGYMYDVNEKRTGVYHNHSSPFHTLMIPTQIFSDPKQYWEQVWSKAGDHSKVNDSFYTHGLPDWKFTVLIHGNNFISDFNYAREKDEPTPIGFTLDRFLNQPVVFDMDDFCDIHSSCLKDLKILKDQYPKFKCTLFTIPNRTSDSLLREAHKTGFIELCPHGVNHHPNEELRAITKKEEFLSYLLSFNQKPYSQYYTKGFRPPGWYIDTIHIDALNEAGYWCAIHDRDRGRLARRCQHGYYICGERFPYHHAHTHDTCNNWLSKDLNMLLVKWKRDQEFMYVSEAIMKR